MLVILLSRMLTCFAEEYLPNVVSHVKLSIDSKGLVPLLRKVAYRKVRSLSYIDLWIPGRKAWIKESLIAPDKPIGKTILDDSQKDTNVNFTLTIEL